MNHRKGLLYFGIGLGFVLYYSRYLRTDFKGHESILFWLGFLPNFGLAFALPLCYIANRINLHKTVNYFNSACITTLLIMILNEVVDKFQPKRVFDWFDIYASITGVLCTLIFYNLIVKK